MILIDGNYFAKRYMHVCENNIDFFRHLFINNIITLKNKYEGIYGNIVIAIDHKSWRKEYVKTYKANRPKIIELDEFIQEAYAAYTEMINILKYTSLKTIQVYGAEADDIIAVLSKSSGKHLIYSGDKDLYQLINNNVDYYDFNKKDFINLSDVEIKKHLENLIIQGDISDNIERILYNAEPSDEFKHWFSIKYDRILTQKLYTNIVFNKNEILELYIQEHEKKPYKIKKISKQLQESLENKDYFEQWLKENPIIKYNYNRNKKLINLNYIPTAVKDRILIEYNKQKNKKLDITPIMNYINKYNLDGLKDKIQNLTF